jgi:hypothetical protein
MLKRSRNKRIKEPKIKESKNQRIKNQRIKEDFIRLNLYFKMQSKILNVVDKNFY